ncbi:hypothetical protein U1Q18_049837 [Sarracenia purpurea var. burkii]
MSSRRATSVVASMTMHQVSRDQGADENEEGRQPFRDSKVKKKAVHVKFVYRDLLEMILQAQLHSKLSKEIARKSRESEILYAILSIVYESESQVRIEKSMHTQPATAALMQRDWVQEEGDHSKSCDRSD